MRHINDLSELSLQEFDELYKLTTNILARPEGYADACRGKVLASLFYEPSTRTNLSFSTAMMRLGGNVIGFTDPNSTSAAKGESLKDTVNMVAAYADMIVMRNPREGAALAASLFSSVPVINAGDGGHLHPTQTLADMTTILCLRGSASHMKIGLCGDLKYGRTVHSLIKFLEKFDDVEFYLIAPPELAIPAYLRAFMQQHKLPFHEVSSLESVLPVLDVLYMTRIQKERFACASEHEALHGIYCLNAQKLLTAKKELLIMHPLPRVDEIAQDVDDDPRAVYFEQARIAMFARMALLLILSRQPHEKPHKLPQGATDIQCTNPNCITKSEPYLPILSRCDAQDDSCMYCAYCDKPVDPLTEPVGL